MKKWAVFITEVKNLFLNTLKAIIWIILYCATLLWGISTREILTTRATRNTIFVVIGAIIISQYIKSRNDYTPHPDDKYAELLAIATGFAFLLTGSYFISLFSSLLLIVGIESVRNED